MNWCSVQRHRDREREEESWRQREIHRERETEIKRDNRDRDRQKKTERDRKRERERERKAHVSRMQNAHTEVLLCQKDSTLELYVHVYTQNHTLRFYVHTQNARTEFYVGKILCLNYMFIHTHRIVCSNCMCVYRMHIQNSMWTQFYVHIYTRNSMLECHVDVQNEHTEFYGKLRTFDSAEWSRPIRWLVCCMLILHIQNSDALFNHVATY